MLVYLAGRLAQGVFVLWAAFTVTFFVLYILPGDPVSIMLSASGDSGFVTPEMIADLRAKYGLDQPLAVQYLTTLGNFATGNWGISYETSQPVAQTVLAALPETLKLTGLGLLFALVGGGAIAIGANLVGWRPLQQLLLSLPPVGISIPSFWTGLLLMQFVSFTLGWLPAVGNKGFESLILPAITIAIPTSAAFAQVLAAGLLSAGVQPYMEVVRAKGAGPARAVLRHGLRNSVIPALTIFAVTVGNLVAGTVVVETVFSRVGLGRLTQNAVANQDVPMMQAIVVLCAIIFVLVNLAVDVAYPFIDPRLRRTRAAAA